MRAMNALGRRTFYLKHWVACGAGITGPAAALFIPFKSLRRASSYNNYYDLRNASGCQYS
jgi:hypothetical protein